MVTSLKIMGEHLKELRKEKRIYQREMGELLGVTSCHYQKIEYGKVNISVTNLDILADYFGVSTDYLLGRTEERLCGNHSLCKEEAELPMNDKLCRSPEDDIEKLLDALCERLHQLRKERNLRQKDVAEFLGMTLRNYQRIDAGETDVAASMLCKLAGYFGVSVDYLLGRTEER